MDRLVKLGIITEMNCVLCCTGNESCNHFFFQCEHAAYIGQEYSNAACNIEGILNGSVVIGRKNAL